MGTAELPRFARERFTRWHARRGTRRAGPPVNLWLDTFTNSFHPDVGEAAVAVLENAGFTVEVPARLLCCGLTWISTGQLGVAGQVLKRTIATLRPALQAGRRVVALEPAARRCSAPTRPSSLGSDDARLLAWQTTTLAELLGERSWRPPPTAGGGTKRKAIAQVHCHQDAIVGFDAERELLKACRVDLDLLDAGYCGLAGNFGFERGHYDVSVAMPSTVCGRRSGARTQLPPFSPTGSPDAPRSRPAISAGRGSTSPSCSPGCWVRIRTAERTGPRTRG
jgi:Fe-S oxidoreductase